MRKSLFIALSLLASGASIAQTNPAPQSTLPGQTSQTTGKTMSDQTFVREASAAGLAEVADAQKAMQMAKRGDVRHAPNSC